MTVLDAPLQSVILAGGEDNIGHCISCGSRDVEPFLSIGQIPVDVGYLWPTPEQACAAPVGDIRLAFCRTCAHVWNYAFEPERVVYGPGYDASLHFSPVYQEFTSRIAAQLIARHGLHNKLILEIASGNGDFLRALCEGGGNRGIGFVPSFRADRIESRADIRIVRDYYSEQYAGYRGDFVCFRHVLSCLAEPRGLVSMVRRTLGQRLDAAVYFEIPNALRILTDVSVWSLMYEHVSYFSPQSLAHLFTSCGFTVLSSAPCFANQYVAIEAVPRADGQPPRDEPFGTADDVADAVVSFGRRYEARIADWRTRLEAFARDGRRLIAWGAGGRAITFLNLLNVREQIPYVIDINPNRQGHYLPGTTQRVVSPDFAVEYRPDAVIVTNPAFEEEIRGQIAEMGLTCELIVI